MSEQQRRRRLFGWVRWWAFAVISALYVAGATLDVWNGGERVSTGAWGGSSGPLLEILFLCAVYGFPVAGLLITRRVPTNPIGWLLLAIGGLWGLDSLLTGYVQRAVVVAPGSLPAGSLVEALESGLWVFLIGLMGVYLLLLFPDGHPPSPRWRWFARTAAAALSITYLVILLAPGSFADSGYPQIHNPLGIAALREVLITMRIVIVLIPLCVIGAAAALVVRFRRSRGVERLQMKWLAAGAGAVALVYLVTMAATLPLTLAGRTDPPWLKAMEDGAMFSFVVIPICIGVAILRYRLYDIDRIISRTLAYFLSMTVLAGVYAGVVLVASAVSPLHGDSPVVVATSTLILAAAFRPLLDRMKVVIDARFNRAHYSRTLVLEDFARSARDEVDLSRLTHNLVVAVDAAMAPASVSLWIRQLSTSDSS